MGGGGERDMLVRVYLDLGIGVGKGGEVGLMHGIVAPPEKP